MTKRFWWNCDYKKSTNKIVYCTKYNNHCLKSKCEELYDHKGKLEKELGIE